MLDEWPLSDLPTVKDVARKAYSPRSCCKDWSGTKRDVKFVRIHELLLSPVDVEREGKVAVKMLDEWPLSDIPTV